MDNNKKRVLCKPMLNDKKCDYGNKCVYAHNLNDQKIDTMRHKAYTIIKSTQDLSTINLVNDNELFEHLNMLTKVCYLCSKNICPGGYNCRYGAINNKLRICYDDLMYGNCRRTNCMSVHLTKRGLVPRAIQQGLINKDELDDVKKKLNINISDTENGGKKIRRTNNRCIKTQYIYDIDNENDCDDEINKDKYKRSHDLDYIIGTLITDKFISDKYNNESDSDIDEDKLEKIIEYLNNDSDLDEER
jgi:hypothetical protein